VLLLLNLAAAAICAEPAVFRIVGENGNDVWLLGSVHYLRERDYPLPEVIEVLYTRADALVMEIDLDDLNPISVQGQFMQAAMLPADRSLRGVLSESAYADAAERASQFGLPLEAFERFEPWLVALTLMDLQMANLGFSADQGLEQYLLRRAAVDGKPIHGLESLADQIGVFDDLPAQEQEALLVQTLNELESPAAEMDALLDAWHAGDLESLAEELFEAFKEFPKLYDALVVTRNQRWLPELERLAREPGEDLVIVGALHLVGEDSVVEMLRDRGFEVLAEAAP
jgi:hypothetical protein